MIYFDSAATTFQKPKTVEAAVEHAMRTMSSPGRGGYPAAMQAADTVFACRNEIAELYHMTNPEQVVFTLNATHALNLAIKSLVPPGGTVVISGYEHNAVTRPLSALHADIRVAAAPLFQEDAAVAAFAARLTDEVDAVICSHVSNVFGFVQPVERIAALCQARKIPLIIDASQSAGLLELDFPALHAAFLAMPGHKSLYGPQGVGVLLCSGEVPVTPLLEGGTGSNSLRQEMPDFLPDRLEAGTHNVPGIAGLRAGVRYLRRRGMANICKNERELVRMTVESLVALQGLRVFHASREQAQVGVVSFCSSRLQSEELAKLLGERGIAVRAGLHCAPLAHQTAGTLEGGTVRVSFSDFNTEGEVRRFLRVMRELTA